LDKIDWGSLCMNKSIPIDFFEKHENKLDWYHFCGNDFSIYFLNLEKQKYKDIMNCVYEQINLLIDTIPSNVFSVLPRGGQGYLDVIGRYSS